MAKASESRLFPTTRKTINSTAAEKQIDQSKNDQVTSSHLESRRSKKPVSFLRQQNDNSKIAY